MKDPIKEKYDDTVARLFEHLDGTDFKLAERYAYIMMRRMQLFRSVSGASVSTVIEQMEAGGIEFFDVIAGLASAMSEELSITEHGLTQLASFAFDDNFAVEQTTDNEVSYVPTTDFGKSMLVMSEIIGQTFGMVRVTDMRHTKTFEPQWYEQLNKDTSSN